MGKNNTFKTSLIFLGMILAAIILRTYILQESLFKLEDSEVETVTTPCVDGVDIC